MQTRKATRELIQTIINTIDKTFVGTSLIDNGGGSYTIASCNILWLTKNVVITIGVKTYRVTEILKDVSITILSLDTIPVIPSTLIFDISLPYYWHGTLKFTSMELNLIDKSTLKLPMIYLLERTPEQHNENELETIGMISDCRFFIMSETDVENWNQNTHVKYAVEPMRNLTFAFYSAMRAFKEGIEQSTFRENKLNIEDCIKWGKYFFEGSEAKFFNDDVSGTDVKIEIPFLKKYICC